MFAFGLCLIQGGKRDNTRFMNQSAIERGVMLDESPAWSITNLTTFPCSFTWIEELAFCFIAIDCELAFGGDEAQVSANQTAIPWSFRWIGEHAFTFVCAKTVFLSIESTASIKRTGRRPSADWRRGVVIAFRAEQPDRQQLRNMLTIGS